MALLADHELAASTFAARMAALGTKTMLAAAREVPPPRGNDGRPPGIAPVNRRTKGRERRWPSAD